MKETKILEYKENTDTNSFLKTVSAFANYSVVRLFLVYVMMER